MSTRAKCAALRDFDPVWGSWSYTFAAKEKRLAGEAQAAIYRDLVGRCSK